MFAGIKQYNFISKNISGLMPIIAGMVEQAGFICDTQTQLRE